MSDLVALKGIFAYLMRPFSHDLPGMLKVHILSLFPDAIEAYLKTSILGRAQDNDLLQVHVLDFRKFAKGNRRNVDDRPYGGGPGMILKPEPIFSAIEWVESNFGPTHKILLTPDGTPFKQSHAENLLNHKKDLLLLCGRYEGFDERIRQGFDFTEISIGDYILCGGEIAALAIIEATTRLIPDALGHEESAIQESFSGELLDYPNYTRPPEFRGMRVPEILLSGDHLKVKKWRYDKALEKTKERRPDLLDH